MEKVIPYEKLSKKKKRALDAQRRTVWTISPVTRKPENSKAYNRRKAQKWNDDSASVLSVSFLYKCFSSSTSCTPGMPLNTVGTTAISL